MELRHLRYFLAVAEELHFARAATRLGIEQSPLSRQVRDLEADLKVKLFARTRRSTTLTSAGARFMADARRILADIDGSVRSLRASTTGNEPLRLGLAEGLASRAFGRLLRHCQDAEPSIAVVLGEAGLSELVNLTSRGGLDAFLAPQPVTIVDLLSTPAWTEQLTLIAPPAEAGSARSIWLKSRIDDVFILPDGQALPGLARQIEGLLKIKGLSPARDMTAATPATLTRLVAARMGVGLLPVSLAPINGEVALRQLKDTDAGVTTWLTVHRDGPSALMHDLVRAAAAEPHIPGAE